MIHWTSLSKLLLQYASSAEVTYAMLNSIRLHQHASWKLDFLDGRWQETKNTKMKLEASIAVDYDLLDNDTVNSWRWSPQFRRYLPPPSAGSIMNVNNLGGTCSRSNWKVGNSLQQYERLQFKMSEYCMVRIRRRGVDNQTYLRVYVSLF